MQVNLLNQLTHQKNNPDMHWLNDHKQELFYFEGNHLTITSALISNKTEFSRSLLLMLGKFQAISKHAHDIPSFNGKSISFKILTDLEVSKEWEEILEAYHIELITQFLAASTDNV